MKGKAFALAGAAGAFVICGMASAAFLGTEGDLNGGLTAVIVDAAAEGWTAEDGYVGLTTFRIYANFDEFGGDVFAIGDAGLPPGEGFVAGSRDDSFFNAELGSNIAPAANLIPIIPDLAWDTFVTIGGGGVATSPITSVAPDFDAQVMGMTNNFTVQNDGWFVADFPDFASAMPYTGIDPLSGEDTGGNGVLIAQFTVAGTGEGVGVFGQNWRVSVRNDDGSTQDLVMSFDSQIPAPGALALLGLAGLAAGRRRRR